MIDFETLGNGKYACLVQVGACYFGDGQTGKTLKLNFDAEDGQKHGSEIDAPTIYWWLQQSPEARASIAEEPRVTEYDGLTKLNDFLKGAEEVWSHATFDFVILMEALKRRFIKPAFGYKAARDIRTLMAIAPKQAEEPRAGTHHDGLDDALYQARYVMKALAAIGVS